MLCLAVYFYRFPAFLLRAGGFRFARDPASVSISVPISSET